MELGLSIQLNLITLLFTQRMFTLDGSCLHHLSRCLIQTHGN